MAALTKAFLDAILFKLQKIESYFFSDHIYYSRHKT